MRSFRTRCSAVVAWVMIPLAAWAGMPSTACVCANGYMKLFCGCQGKALKTADRQQSDCQSACCSHNAAEADASHASDCCAGGTCCRGAPLRGPGIASKACCRAILTAPSMAPRATSAPNDQTPSVLAIVEPADAVAPCWFVTAAAEFDTGPPLDRVIVFRSLLI